MSSIPTLRTDELERLFADWGRPIRLRRVTASANAVTGQVAESVGEYLVTAVTSPRRLIPTPGTARRHATGRVDFLVRIVELPAGTALSMCRIADGDEEYSVMGTEFSPDGLTVLLAGQRV